MKNLDRALVDDFKDLLIAFVDESVDFLLIGGWAMALHGRVRATDDLDVFVRASAENAQRVFRALAAFGAPVDAHGVTEELFADEGFAIAWAPSPI